MVSLDEFTQMALSFPGTESAPHFDRTAFKVVKRRIFATLDKKNHSANLVLSLTEQKSFCEFDADAIFPVPNKWGEKGWTTFDLKKVSREVLLEGLKSAYSDVAKSR